MALVNLIGHFALVILIYLIFLIYALTLLVEPNLAIISSA
jgi:hypothetical protein